VSTFSWGAVIVAAGRGTRFGRPKQLVEIAGAPMLAWSIRTFAAMPEVQAIVVVTESEWLREVSEIALHAGGAKCAATVPGGATRQVSTFNGLRTMPESCDAVFVHDGARPLVREDDVRSAMAVVRAGHGSLLAAPVVDTIKIVGTETNVVERTLERSLLWAAQTPQFATRGDMLRAHEAGASDAVDATDDAMLLERIGVAMHVVQASPENFKVTLPHDRDRAEHALLARMTEPR